MTSVLRKGAHVMVVGLEGKRDLIIFSVEELDGCTVIHFEGSGLVVRQRADDMVWHGNYGCEYCNIVDITEIADERDG